jgi:beta-glucosidase
MTKILFIFLVFIAIQVHAQRPAIPYDPELEAAVRKRLKAMTLDEKIGQMMQFSVDQIGQPDKKGAFVINPEKTHSVFGTYHIGSILNMLGNEASTPQVWNSTIRAIQKANFMASGIPVLYGLDQVHGTTYTAGGTLFPQHIGMAATFNPSLAKKMGEICAYETRSCGIPWIFCPDLDLGRKPSWPRCYEGLGEDPYLSKVMGLNYLAGLQGNDPNHIDKYHVGTTLKHYMAYGVPDNGIDRTPATVTGQDLREKYFEPFRALIRQGALSIMTNSALVNGMTGCANKELLTDWLKRDLDWDGMIITDWGDINGLCERDHFVRTKKEAIEKAVNAGIDMMMIASDTTYFSYLKQLVQEKKVSTSRIDDAVSRILRLKYRIGLFNRPVTNLKDYPLVGSKQYADTALKMATESEVLLKNEDNVLPLKPGTRILLCGPNANSMRCLDGGWSYTWQGTKTDKFTKSYHTILKAMQNVFGKEDIIYEEGVSYDNSKAWDQELKPQIEKAVKAADDADVIVACIGENSYAETTGNITDANLSQNQKELVLALEKIGKPVILVLNEGRARLIQELVPAAKAIVDIMLPGNYGGDALANLLSGKANFSGRLPFTYPSFPNAFTTYDYKVCEARKTIPGIYDYHAETSCEWWFGSGLSYTTFAYKNMKASQRDFTRNDSITFTVDVTNTGTREGMNTVMLFSTDTEASDVIPDNRRLRAFEKIDLKPGETKKVTLKLKGSDLAYVRRDGHWTLEKGDFYMRIGDEEATITCTDNYTWQTPNKDL